MPQPTYIGRVVSIKMQKTINVLVDRFGVNKKFGLSYRWTKKFMTHDESMSHLLPRLELALNCPSAFVGIVSGEAAGMGDTVMIRARYPPASKLKKHELVKIVRAAPKL